MIKITIIFVTLFLFTIAACDECETCNDPEYISGYTELESLSCKDLSTCGGAYLPESECKENNYPEDCHECVIKADSCKEVSNCFEEECYGEEGSFNNNANNSNNTTPVVTTSEDDLCNIIRIDCGYDNIDHDDCTDNLMTELGAFGQECVDKAIDCLAVAECLSTYTAK